MRDAVRARTPRMGPLIVCTGSEMQCGTSRGAVRKTICKTRRIVYSLLVTLLYGAMRAMSDYPLAQEAD